MITFLTLCLFEATPFRLLAWAEKLRSQGIPRRVAFPGSLGACRSWQSCSAGADGVGEPVFTFPHHPHPQPFQTTTSKGRRGPVTLQLGVWPDCGPSMVKVQNRAGWAKTVLGGKGGCPGRDSVEQLTGWHK